MDIRYNLQITGTLKGARSGGQIDAYVSFNSPASHRTLVEQYFADHLGLDLDQMKRDHPDHFRSPHNVAHALLIFKYCEPRWLRFTSESYKEIESGELPTRAADVADNDCLVWVDLKAK